MKKIKKLEKISSARKLEYIHEMIGNINMERIIAAVQSIKKNEDISRLLRLFSDLNNTFVEEEERLLDKMSEHNNKYANKDNGKYNTAYKSLSCIKKSVMALYPILNNFTPKKKSPYYNQTDTKGIEWKFDHSYLSNLPCEGYLFDNMTPSQERLVKEISAFLNYLDRNLENCKMIVEEEERISNNQDECLIRLDKQIDELYDLVSEKKSYKIDDPYFRDLVNVEEHPENAKTYFHRISPKQLINVAGCKLEKKLRKYTNLERKVFKNKASDIERFRKVVYYVANIPEKITGEIMVYIHKYFDCDTSNRSFYQCFAECYCQIGGKQKLVSYQQYNSSCTEYRYNETDEYYNFRQKLDMALLK